MKTIHEQIEKLAYEVKYLLEDINYEGLQNEINCRIDESGLQDVCCSINYDWSTFDADMYEQGLSSLCCNDDLELLNLLNNYKNEYERILN